MNCHRLCVPVLLAIGAARAWADSSDPAVQFLFVPDSAWSTNLRREENYPLDELPGGLRDFLRKQDLRYKDGLPEVFPGFRLDLNRDEIPEYFLKSSFGGTGGAHYFLLTREDAGWRVLASVMGTVHVLKSEKGWPDLVAVSRGGGGIYSKLRLSHQAGEYQAIASERFDNGRITSTKLKP